MMIFLLLGLGYSSLLKRAIEGQCPPSFAGGKLRNTVATAHFRALTT